MFLELFLILSVCLLVWLTRKWSKVSRYWAERGVPHAPPHPIFGSLTFLLKENIAYWLIKLREQFPGPYCGVWLFWRPALVVHCPEIARRILVKDSDNFRNRFLRSGKGDPIGALNIFTVNDPLWSNIRRRLTPVFTSSKLRVIEALVHKKTADLIERINTEINKNPTEIEVRDICTDYTTDIIGEASFGIKSEATRCGDSPIRLITKVFMKFSVYRGLAWSSIFFFPSLVDCFGFSLFPRHTISQLREIFRGMVQLRGGELNRVKEPRDLLDSLLKIKQEAADEKDENINEDVVLAQAAVFVQAGFDTTAAALVWTLVELARRPPLQEKLYRALVEAREELGRDLDAAALANVPYLNAVIKETLRMYPAMGWLDREAAREYAIDDKLTLPAGAVVYVSAVGMARDPAHFPRPDLYDPDRFMPENEGNIPPYAYLPFGDGPRSCIGMRFANQTLRIGLCALALHFRWGPGASPAPRAQTKGLFFVPSGTVPLHFTRRNAV